MSTFMSSTVVSMANTAALQSLGAELNGWLSGSGLVQTADTGQVNWGTVTLPGSAGAAIGYEIWRFADSSLYFRLDWKTGLSTNTNAPNLLITVGTGSDGAGNITGQTSPQQSAGPYASVTNSITSTSTAYPTYICRTADFFGIVWKCGAGSVSGANCSLAGWAIEKTVDSSGAVTSVGYIVTSANSTNTAAVQSKKQAVRTTATAQTFSNTTSFCLVPANPTSSVKTNGDKQIFLHQQLTPELVQSNYLCTVVTSEVPLGTTFTATPVGSTSHTFIGLAGMMGTGNSASVASTWGTAMRWE